MRELGLVPVQPRPFRITTVPDPDAPETVDLLRRDFCAEPGRDQGRRRHHLYPDVAGLAVFGDADRLFQPRVIGWSMADHLRTELVTDALDMALRDHRLEPDCIMHSDRGTQYTSAEYRATLTRLPVAAFGRADRSMLG